MQTTTIIITIKVKGDRWMRRFQWKNQMDPRPHHHHRRQTSDLKEIRCNKTKQYKNLHIKTINNNVGKICKNLYELNLYI